MSEGDSKTEAVAASAEELWLRAQLEHAVAVIRRLADWADWHESSGQRFRDEGSSSRYMTAYISDARVFAEQVDLRRTQGSRAANDHPVLAYDGINSDHRGNEALTSGRPGSVSV